MSTRRDMLRIGGSIFGGLNLPRLLAASKGPANNCIILFQEGGACQHDSFDPKPEQTSDIRGSFKSIPTAVAGVHFSELLPRCAQSFKKFAVIRSVYSREAIHEKAKQYIFSGARPNNAFKHPVYGSVVAKELGARNGLPPFVCIPRKDICADAGLLGSAYDPFITGDPAAKAFKVQDLALPNGVSLEETASRARLLAAMDEEIRVAEKSKIVEGMDHFYQKAFDLVSSSAARKAFDLSEERDTLRDSYGRTGAGQGGGRIEMYGSDFLAQDYQAERGNEAVLTGLLDRYGITWTLFSPDAGAVLVMDHLAGWERVYADQHAIIHRRLAGDAKPGRRSS